MADSPLPASGGEANVSTRYSSSPELSSPPRSLSDPGSPAAEQLQFDNRTAQESIIVVDNNGGVDSSGKLAPKLSVPDSRSGHLTIHLLLVRPALRQDSAFLMVFI